MSLVQGTAYSFVNNATFTFLDLSGADNQTVQGWQNNGGFANQKWIASKEGEGWTFKNGRTGAYLSLRNYCGGSGSRVVVSTYPVVWKLIAVSPSNFILTLPLTNDDLALDLFGSNPANGTSVNVFTRHGRPNQVWRLVAASA